MLSCNSGPRKVISPHVGKNSTSTAVPRHDTFTIDRHDPYETGKDTLRLNSVMHKIFKFPEVQAIQRQIIKNSKGKHGVSIMVSDEFDGDTSYYDFEVGDNSREERYENVFDFILVKKTGQIKVFDTVSDSIMSLKDWRKTRH